MPDSSRLIARRTRFGAAMLVACFAFAGVLTGPVPAEATANTVDLGTLTDFSTFAGTSVDNSGSSVLSGNVGVSPGTTVTGFPPGTVTGAIHTANAAAARAQTDLSAAYADAAGRAPTRSIAGDLAGQTLTAGVYHASAALTVSTTLTLDGQGDPHAVFIFQVNAALNTAAASRIKLTNGAQASQVFWQVFGAATLGASSSFVGTLLCREAVTVGASAGIIGRVASVNGPVTLSSNPINPHGPVQLGAAFDFSVLAATEVLSTGSSTINANIGVSPGTTISGFPPGIYGGEAHTADAVSGQAQIDFRTAYTEITARQATGVLEANPGGQTLTAGIYASGKSVALGSTLTLDGQNNPNSVFILKINGNLTTSAATRIVLANGTKPNRVFWQVTGGTNLGPGTVFSGTLLGTGSIELQSGVRVMGRVLSLSGSVTLLRATFTSLAPIRLGTLAGFSVLAGTAVSNVGPTVLNMSVGVSPGSAITGFPPGTTTYGSVHTADTVAAQAHTDAVAAYHEALALDPTATINGDLAGRTLRSGVYASTTALSVSTVVTLDGQNDPNGVFIFLVDAAFNMAAGSQIRLINGADPTRVFWQVTGAVTLGASAEFAGTVISTGAVTAGDQAVVRGRMISLDGAITLSTNTFDSPLDAPGTLTVTASGATLNSITLDGIATQYATGQSGAWSISDERSTGADWSVSVSATVPTSSAGTVDTVDRQLPVGSLHIAVGPVTAGPGADSASGLSVGTGPLTERPLALLSSNGTQRGAYTFRPTFTLEIPPGAYRSNFSGTIDGSPVVPYVSVITVTIS